MNKYNKLLILSDSFKNSISSKDIGEIGKKVFLDLVPTLNVETFRIADGGEGTVDFFINELGYKKVEVDSINAFLKPIKTYYGVKDNTAVFDVASCVGYLVNDHLDLWHASTYGVGKVLKEIIKKGYKRIYLGLGGSITNDGGMGILGALGAKFYNQQEEVIPFNDHSIMFDKVDLIKVFELIKDVELIGLCDVNNPLLGQRGATFTYGPQKGGDLETLNQLESWMSNYSKLFSVDSNMPGCGAAGGIGFCLNILSANLVSGIKVMLDELKILDKIDNKTLLITGEGALDHTSFQGKVIGYLLDIAKKNQTDTIIICGINNYQGSLKEIVYPLHKTPVPNYQETVFEDVKNTFKKILKDKILDFINLELKRYDYLPTDIMDLRKEVFVIEQGIDEKLEFDNFESISKHYGLYLNQKLVGTLRLIKINEVECKIGRIIIEKNYRGLGLGKYLINSVLSTTNYNTYLVHAQTSKMGFYEKNGFVSIGDSFLEDGILHIKMYLKK